MLATTEDTPEAAALCAASENELDRLPDRVATGVLVDGNAVATTEPPAALAPTALEGLRLVVARLPVAEKDVL